MKTTLITVFLLIIFTITVSAQTKKKPVMHTKLTIDLNADGKKDVISVKKIKDSTDHTHILHINDQKFKFHAEDEGEPIKGFEIKDLDKSDKFKEIVVQYVNNYDNFRYKFFRYDGKKIHYMGYAYSLWMQMPILHKKGRVISKNHMGFWTLNELYKINQKTHKLEVVPQDLYYVGISYEMTCERPIYAKKGSSVVIDTLYPKTNAQILLFDSDLNPAQKKDEDDSHYPGWYLISTENGVLGWLRYKDVIDPCFKDLVMAG